MENLKKKFLYFSTSVIVIVVLPYRWAAKVSTPLHQCPAQVLEASWPWGRCPMAPWITAKATMISGARISCSQPMSRTWVITPWVIFVLVTVFIYLFFFTKIRILPFYYCQRYQKNIFKQFECKICKGIEKWSHSTNDIFLPFMVLIVIAYSIEDCMFI